MEILASITDLEDYRNSHPEKVLDKKSDNILDEVSELESYVVAGTNNPTTLEPSDIREVLRRLNDDRSLNDNRVLFRYARLANYLLESGENIIEETKLPCKEESLKVPVKLIGKAACRGLDNRLFFTSSKKIIEESVKICNSCPVKADCLNIAVENNESFGIWGGVLVRRIKRKKV
jgi:WhiB family transcriptional regulator, redox-sensing transcriptional regulator